MIADFTIETEELPGLESEVRSVIDAAMKLRVCDPQAAYDLLTRSQSDVESVSVSRKGRFFNQRALALKQLGEYDRAILEFDRAADCFEKSGELNLQGMVYNNIARLYSLLGNHDRAHESVDEAIRLLTDPVMLGQAQDQKAKIYLDESRPAEAEIESREAVYLLRQSEREPEQAKALTEAIVTRAMALVLCGKLTEARAELNAMCCIAHSSCFDQKPVLEDSAPKTLALQTSETKDDPSMAETLARSRDLLHAITANDDAEHAWELMELLDKNCDREDPIARATMRHLYTLTAEFEIDFQRRMERVRPPPPIEAPAISESESNH